MCFKEKRALIADFEDFSEYMSNLIKGIDDRLSKLTKKIKIEKDDYHGLDLIIQFDREKCTKEGIIKLLNKIFKIEKEHEEFYMINYSNEIEVLIAFNKVKHLLEKEKDILIESYTITETQIIFTY